MSFALLNNEFINLYSQDNPILEKNDICYFLLFNMHDYHRPIIAKGIIIEDKFLEGMNKEYFVKIFEFIESPKTINSFILNKSFIIYPYNNETNIIGTKKMIQILENLDFTNYLFKTESFFVRNSEQKIKELFIDYIKVLKKDILKQLSDIDLILNE